MNLVAIMLATCVAFILGMVWYAGLFGDVWFQEAGISKEKASMKPIFESFFYALLAAWGFDTLMPFIHSLQEALYFGLIVGIVFIGTSLKMNYQFLGKSHKLFLIDAGYHVMQFALYALIFWYVK